MIDWQQIDIPPNKTTGKIRSKCPACSADRKKKSEKCLAVDLMKGLAFCHNCQEVSVRPDETDFKEYEVPDQSWRNFTQLSDPLVKWFKEVRKISQTTLIDCKITEEQAHIPSKRKMMNCIVFNYLEDDVLINKKYRDGTKGFTQTTNTKKIFYGLNDIADGEVIICEGEMDKLAYWEAGYKSVISVPNGANDLNDVFQNCEDYVKDLTKVFISADTDLPGRKLESELIRRFGKWRCLKVILPDDCKDANDVLIKHSKLDLEECVRKAVHMPVEGAFNAGDIETEIKSLYHEGWDPGVEIKNNAFNKVNDLFKFGTAQMTIVTGIPGHGKSTFIEWYLMCLLAENDDLHAGFYSPEHLPMRFHQSLFAEKYSGKPFNSKSVDRMTEEQLEEYINWSKNKIHLIYPEKGEIVGWDWLMDKWRELIFRYGINIIVVDAWNKVKMKERDTDAINDVLSELNLFKQLHEVHIILIVHPRKINKKETTNQHDVPTLYDLAGSAHYYNQMDTGIIIYRHFNEGDGNDDPVDFITAKVKWKHLGRVGITSLRYDKSCGRYYEDQPVTGVLTALDQPEATKVEPEVKQLEPDGSFSIEDISDEDWKELDNEDPPF